jgi:hypothetical protein
MTTTAFIAGAVLVFAAALVGGQDRPDFSGEWVLNRAASKLSAGADAVETGVWHIEHREPVFQHQAALVFRGGRPLNYQYTMRSDGAEVVGKERGAKVVMVLRWDGTALVFTTRTARADGEVTVSYRYEITEGGRHLHATEQVRGTGREQDNVWVFDRR